MRRTATISGLFAAGLFALAAAGQQPPPDKKPGSGSAVTVPGNPGAGRQQKDGDAKPAGPSTEQLIAAALVHDPDIRIAQAKVRLAEAEQAKTRQQVIQKVTALHATVQEHRRSLERVRVAYAQIQEVEKAGAAPPRAMQDIRAKLAEQQEALARVELELKAVTGGGPGAVPPCEPARQAGITDCAKCHTDPFGAEKPADTGFRVTAGQGFRVKVPPLGEAPAPDAATAHQLFQYWVAGRGESGAAARGPIPDRIRAALDKKVTLGPKGEAVPFDKALEVFKASAGFDAPVRNNFKTTGVQSLGEELPVGAWFQMYADANPDLAFLVRDYGLLVTLKPQAPPDALSVAQLWKTPAAAKPATKGEPAADGVLKGKPIKLSLDDTETLILAAFQLQNKSSPAGGPPLVVEREWAAVLKGDHLRLVVPDATRYAPVPGQNTGHKELVIDLSQFPDAYPAVYVRSTGGRSAAVFSHRDAKPEAAAAFTDTLRKLGVGK